MRSTSATKKLQIIDLVRSFSILVVLALHSDVLFKKSISPWGFWLWDHFQRNGVYGVYLFFTVSGFLIAGVIANNPGGFFKPNWRLFYVQRAGRILPLLILSVWLGICILQVPSARNVTLDVFFPEAGRLAPLFWLSIPSFLFNWFVSLSASSAYGLHWGILWSLSVEEQFYLLLPPSLKKLGKERNLVFSLLIVIVIGFVWRTACYYFAPSNKHLQVFSTFGAFDNVALGILLYLASQRWDAFLSRRKTICVLLCGLGFLAMILIYFGTSIGDGMDRIYAGPLLCGGLFSFLLGGRHLSFFESKALWVFGLPGKYCYGLYLLHPSLLAVLFPLLYQGELIPSFAVFVLISTAVAGLSYHLFEMPANRLVRRTFGSWTKKKS